MKDIVIFIFQVIRGWIESRFYAVKPNKIVFSNFDGKGYGCNPKYIAEELIKRRSNYDLVWLVNDTNIELPKEIRPVYCYGRNARKELASAKIWISNVRNYRGVEKKKNQFYIQTWHAAMGFKKVEAENPKANSVMRLVSRHDGRLTNLMMANNNMRYEQMRNNFWYKGEILRCGCPRNAPLFDSEKSVKKVKEFFKILDKQSVILYAPTFRGSKPNSTSVYEWNYSKIVNAFSEKYSKECVLLLRLHPNVSSLSENLCRNNIINATYYPDMQELLATADFLITDFSSCSFDFAFAQKPVFLYAKDKDEYLKDDQGICIDISTLPFPFVDNEDDLINCIMADDEETRLEKYSAYFNRIGLEEDGRGAEMIADIIDNIIDDKIV